MIWQGPFRCHQEEMHRSEKRCRVLYFPKLVFVRVIESVCSQAWVRSLKAAARQSQQRDSWVISWDSQDWIICISECSRVKFFLCVYLLGFYYSTVNKWAVSDIKLQAKQILNPAGKSEPPYQVATTGRCVEYYNTATILGPNNALWDNAASLDPREMRSLLFLLEQLRPLACSPSEQFVTLQMDEIYVRESMDYVVGRTD